MKENKKILDQSKGITELLENEYKKITLITYTLNNFNNRNFISYYNLLSFLECGISFKEVALCKFNKKISYIYDGNNYILKNKNKVGAQFELFLSDCDSDSSKFIKNIEIIKI